MSNAKRSYVVGEHYEALLKQVRSLVDEADGALTAGKGIEFTSAKRLAAAAVIAKA